MVFLKIQPGFILPIPKQFEIMKSIGQILFSSERIILSTNLGNLFSVR